MQTEFYSLRLSKIFVRLSTCDSQVQGLVEGGCCASGLSPKRGLMNCYLASQLGEVRFRRGRKMGLHRWAHWCDITLKTAENLENVRSTVHRITSFCMFLLWMFYLFNAFNRYTILLYVQVWCVTVRYTAIPSLLIRKWIWRFIRDHGVPHVHLFQPCNHHTTYLSASG